MSVGAATIGLWAACRPRLGWLTALALVAIVGATAGCGSSGAGFATQTAFDEDAERHPDGVAIDLPGAVPAPRTAAEASDGVVTLEVPLSEHAVLDTVRRYFEAVEQENPAALRGELTPDVLFVAGGSVNDPNAQMAAFLYWERRFDRLDYLPLSVMPEYRRTEPTIYRGRHLLDGVSSPVATVPPWMLEDDVVVQVPLIQKLTPSPLFGDEMVLFLRREGQKYKIYLIIENFQLS